MGAESLRDLVLAFLDGEPSNRVWSRAGIARALGRKSKNGLLGVLRALETDGLVRCGWPAHGPAHYSSARAKPPPKLTPSEVALSKVLAAWVEWVRAEWAPGGEVSSESADSMREVGGALHAEGLVVGDGEATDTGAALLGRARKAGVL